MLRARDLDAHGIPRTYLSRLYRRGVLERVGRGLYVLAGADVTEQHTLVQAARRVPHGVVCLLSALAFHELTTQQPFEVWMAIGKHARTPEPEFIPLRVVYMSGTAFESGVEDHCVEGVQVRVYGAAKTVADCFKYRSRIGVDVAVEALRDYRKSRLFDADALWRMAGICRVQNVMRPYLEAIA